MGWYILASEFNYNWCGSQRMHRMHKQNHNCMYTAIVNESSQGWALINECNGLCNVHSENTMLGQPPPIIAYIAFTQC